MNATFEKLLNDEIDRARSKGYSCRSWHEAAGLIKEEYDEFWDIVKKKPSKRDRDEALKELVQIASLCARAAEDLALIDDYEKRDGFFKRIVAKEFPCVLTEKG